MEESNSFGNGLFKSSMVSPKSLTSMVAMTLLLLVSFVLLLLLLSLLLDCDDSDSDDDWNKQDNGEV